MIICSSDSGLATDSDVVFVAIDLHPPPPPPPPPPPNREEFWTKVP